MDLFLSGMDHASSVHTQVQGWLFGQNVNVQAEEPTCNVWKAHHGIGGCKGWEEKGRGQGRRVDSPPHCPVMASPSQGSEILTLNLAF